MAEAETTGGRVGKLAIEGHWTTCLLGLVGTVRIPDLTLLVFHKTARIGVNSRTGKNMKILSGKAPPFRTAKSLKEAAQKAK